MLLNKNASLTRREDFDRVFKEGKSFVSQYIVVNAVENGLKEVRIGFIVSKKMGNAVKRNRVRRLLKESFRKSTTKPKEGYDLVVIPRSSLKDKSIKCQVIEEDVERVMQKMNESFNYLLR